MFALGKPEESMIKVRCFYCHYAVHAAFNVRTP